MDGELMLKKKAWCSNCGKVVSVSKIGDQCPDCGTDTEEL